MSPAALLERAGFAGEVRLAEPMASHTSLGIGGPAEAMAFPDKVEELAKLLLAAKENGVPVFVLSGGTNLLVKDGGIPGLVINMGKLSWIELERGEPGTSRLHAGAGVRLAKLIGYCTVNGLSGLEFAAGIPGTLGGAVAMNAGAGETEMKDVLVSVTLAGPDGGIRTLPAAGLRMGYRHTELPEGSVVAEASVAVIPWPKEEVRELVRKTIRRRKATQPLEMRSAGSTFKNPPGYSAWRLIEMAGLRGMTVGGAQVSMRHTNFLVNTGGATAKDYMGLVELVIKTVGEKLNITLEPEIKIVGVEN
jgi:UDP-N-acetylmuramate dehydrogenase